MDVTVGGNTDLGAGKIISESGDLKLDTGTLTYGNFDGQKGFTVSFARRGLKGSAREHLTRGGSDDE